MSYSSAMAVMQVSTPSVLTLLCPPFLLVTGAAPPVSLRCVCVCVCVCVQCSPQGTCKAYGLANLLCHLDAAHACGHDV